MNLVPPFVFLQTGRSFGSSHNSQYTRQISASMLFESLYLDKFVYLWPETRVIFYLWPHINPSV